MEKEPKISRVQEAHCLGDSKIDPKPKGSLNGTQMALKCKMAKAQKGSKRMPSPRCIVPKGIKVHLTMSKKAQKKGEKISKEIKDKWQLGKSLKMGKQKNFGEKKNYS